MQAIKAAITKLSGDERHSLALWLNELDYDEWDKEMVKDFSPASADPSFRDAILPRRLDACLSGIQTRRLQKVDDVAIEFRVAVEDHVTLRARFGKGLAKASFELRGKANFRHEHERLFALF